MGSIKKKKRISKSSVYTGLWLAELFITTSIIAILATFLKLTNEHQQTLEAMWIEDKAKYDKNLSSAINEVTELKGENEDLNFIVEALRTDNKKIEEELEVLRPLKESQTQALKNASTIIRNLKNKNLELKKNLKQTKANRDSYKTLANSLSSSKKL